MLWKIIVAVLANALGLWAADYFLAKVSFQGQYTELAITALVLTLLNWVLKPLLKMLFGPVILLTLGLALIVVNVIILLIVDNLFQNLSIEGIATVVYASLIISLSNFVLHIFTRK